jgi:hypothetical protein
MLLSKSLTQREAEYIVNTKGMGVSKKGIE